MSQPRRHRSKEGMRDSLQAVEIGPDFAQHGRFQALLLARVGDIYVDILKSTVGLVSTYRIGKLCLLETVRVDLIGLLWNTSSRGNHSRFRRRHKQHC